MFIRRSQNKHISVKRRTPKVKKNSRFLELAIVAIFAMVVVYGASFALKITNGVSKTIDSPVQSIRLQILNGCGMRGVADKIARGLPSLIKPPLEVSVLEVFDFKAYDVKKSFLISREPDLSMAAALAGQLGLESENIVYEPIENNYRSITVTLVLGTDCSNLFLKSTK